MITIFYAIDVQDTDQGVSEIGINDESKCPISVQDIVRIFENDLYFQHLHVCFLISKSDK